MILPAAADRGIVVFRFLPGLAYSARLFAAFVLVLAGLALQAATWPVAEAPAFFGLAILFAGSLLLSVKGYDNRVDLGGYKAEAEWQKVERERLADVVALHDRMRKWDASALDVTSGFGCLVFLLLAGSLVFLMFAAEGGPVTLLALDAAALLLPHWVTGVRSILTRPQLVVRARFLEAVLDATEPWTREFKVDVLSLLQGRETKLPADFKLKLMPAEPPEGFLGLYGQLVVNSVNGTAYPYFYSVLTARRGFGLGRFDHGVDLDGVIVEYKEESDVEVLVIRQATT
ncbi:MAG: hypothetical protein MUE73_07925, partial [Planctomycetes bacterium]|nr:hypothetical protein [Planctomycetota bacterium]